MRKVARSTVSVIAGCAVLGTCAVVAGMSAPVRHDDIDPLGDIAKSGLPGKTLAAEEILKSELNRRFTDRQNVDFGMSRVIRDGTRLHMGPTMERTMIRTDRPQSRPTANGRYETLIDGTWVSMDQLKPLLHPENDQEKAAVQTFKDQKVDVALYTVGGFGGDDGSKITGPVDEYKNPNPNWQGFTFATKSGLRAKGPAYLQQSSGTAPRAWEVVGAGRKAWRSGKSDVALSGKDGWQYFAHRVEAPDASCARCHSPRGFGAATAQQTDSAKLKVGDPVGVFIIAIRPR
jgi:hypothetical protein